jgi:hypothetical protein
LNVLKTDFEHSRHAECILRNDTFRTIKHSWEKTKNAIPMDELMEGECNSFL